MSRFGHVHSRWFLWLALLCLLMGDRLFAAPEFVWAQAAGSMYPYTNGTMSLRSAVATDAAGNVYVTGGFRGSATFGTNTLVSAGPDANADIFIAKYDPHGQLLWVRQVGGESDDNGNGIAVDGETNVYVTGHFQGSVSFGSTNVTGQGWEDVFVAKYTATGALLWVRTAGGEFRDQGQALALDGAGNVCVTGEFNLTAAFGPFTLTHISQDDVFVTKLDQDGNFLWAASGGGIGQDFGFGIAADQTGNVYVTGYIQYTNTFGSIGVPPLFNPFDWYDVVLAKYDPAGAPVWVRRAGSVSSDGGEAVAVDRSGNIYVTGWMASPSIFGSTNVTRGGSFLAKYKNSGDVEWVRVDEYGTPKGITCDARGDVYVAGDALLLGSDGGYGSRDIVVSKYDANGARLWRQNAGSTMWDSGLDIALDGASNIYLCGTFQGNDSNLAHFGSLTLTNSGGGHNDNFVAKLGSPGVPLRIERLGDNVKISWPPSIPGLLLQQSTNLSGWTTLQNATNGVELPATTSPSFFRLIR